MLGDGSLTKVSPKVKSSYFVEGHGIPQKDYCYWKYKELMPFSCAFEKRIDCKPIKVGDKLVVGQDKRESWCLRTHVNEHFTNMEREWYKRDSAGNYILDHKGWRIKIVPSNIVLTPLTLAIWHFDDGYNNTKKEEIKLHTYGFSEQECAFLADKIKNQFNMKYVNLRKLTGSNHQFSIIINKSSFVDFIELSKKYVPCECMSYKVDISEYTERKHRVIDKDIVQEILKLVNQGLTYTDVAIKMGVKYQTVEGLARRHGLTKPGLWRHNTTGINGVTFDSRLNKKWNANVNVRGRNINLGYFHTVEEAKEAREKADKAIRNGQEVKSITELWEETMNFLSPIVLHKRKENFTFEEIANYLNDNGYKTKRGSKWTKSQVKVMLDKYLMLENEDGK